MSEINQLISLCTKILDNTNELLESQKRERVNPSPCPSVIRYQPSSNKLGFLRPDSLYSMGLGCRMGPSASPSVSTSGFPISPRVPERCTSPDIVCPKLTPNLTNPSPNTNVITTPSSQRKNEDQVTTNDINDMTPRLKQLERLTATPLQESHNSKNSNWFETVYPDTWYRRALHIIYLICISWEIAYISLQTVWGDSSSLPVNTWLVNRFFFMSTIVYLMEMLMNFRTSCIEGWEIIDNDSKILQQHYIKGWFKFDMFITIPWNLILSMFSLDLRGLQYIPRLLRIVRVPSLFQSRSPLMGRPRWAIALVLLFWTWLVVHILALVWIIMAHPSEYDLTNTSPIMTIYGQGLRWAIITLLTGPNGSANCWYTQVYALLVAILGVAIGAVLEGLLVEFFICRDPYKIQVQERKERIIALLHANRVPWSVHKSVTAIAPTFLTTTEGDYNDVMSLLPSFLAEQIMHYVKMALIRAVPMFSLLSDGCVEALALCLQHEIHPDATKVVTRGQVACYMYFVKSGMIDVWIPDDHNDQVEKKVARLTNGCFFGETELFQHQSVMSLTAWTVTVTELFKLDKKHFDVIIQNFPELREQIDVSCPEPVKALRRCFELGQVNIGNQNFPDVDVHTVVSSPSNSSIASLAESPYYNLDSKISRRRYIPHSPTTSPERDLRKLIRPNPTTPAANYPNELSPPAFSVTDPTPQERIRKNSQDQPIISSLDLENILQEHNINSHNTSMISLASTIEDMSSHNGKNESETLTPIMLDMDNMIEEQSLPPSTSSTPPPMINIEDTSKNDSTLVQVITIPPLKIPMDPGSDSDSNKSRRSRLSSNSSNALFITPTTMCHPRLNLIDITGRSLRKSLSTTTRPLSVTIKPGTPPKRRIAMKTINGVDSNQSNKNPSTPSNKSSPILRNKSPQIARGPRRQPTPRPQLTTPPPRTTR